MAAALLLMGEFSDATLSADRLAIGDTRQFGLDVDLLLLLDLVKDHIQMQFTHAGNDILFGLLIEFDTERQILFRNLVQGFVHLDFALLVI